MLWVEEYLMNANLVLYEQTRYVVSFSPSTEAVYYSVAFETSA